MAVTWITAEDLDNPSSPTAASAAESASWILYKLTAEKYAGVRTVTGWYGLQSAECGVCLSTVDTIRTSHYHELIGLGVEQTNTTNSGIRLRGRPVRQIISVVDHEGVTSPSSSYRLVNNAILMRNDDTCWDLARGVTVTYSYGTLPPELGRRAAIKLANELVNLVDDTSACALPDRVTSVTRQGVSYTVLDPQEYIKDGRTGIYEIDLFLHAANPTKAKKRPRVFSPDIPRGHRQ